MPVSSIKNSRPPLLRRFAVNPLGRDFIVGDIHGTFSKLSEKLAAIGFSPETGDRLFSVGDLVDRGPESALVLDWLARPWFFPVQGNHDDMAVRWANPLNRMDAVNYGKNGGAWNIGNLPQERLVFGEALAALPLAIELETSTGLVGIVHAECPFESWSGLTAALLDPALAGSALRFVENSLLWGRDRINGAHADLIEGVRAVVVGHTPVGSFTSLGNSLYIDTMGWRGGEFTILEAETLRPARPVRQAVAARGLL